MKFLQPIFLLVPIVCLFTLTGSAQSSPGKLLLVKGQKLQIDNTIKSVIKQEMMGQSMEMTSDANMIYQVEVKEKKSSSYLVNSTLTKLTSNGSAMGQEMKFDSDKKEDLESETGKALKDQLNAITEAEFNEQAKVISVIKKDTGAAAGSQMTAMIQKFIGGSGDGNNGASAAFIVIPAGKKVGDNWSDSLISESIKTYTNYTFQSLNGNNATIASTATQVTKMTIEQQGMEIKISMDGKITGEDIVNMNTGVLKQRTNQLDGTGNAEVMGQSIPMIIKVITTTMVKTI